MKVIKHLLLFVSIWLLILPGLAQQSPREVRGKIFEAGHNHLHPIIGANVYWIGTTIGAVSDAQGAFSIDRIPGISKLVISFVGFTSDTLDVSDKDYFEVSLKGSLDLEAVQFIKRNKSTELSMINPIKMENVGESELEKAACCNLSESFETNPSVDVSFTDAITGTKQIQMLGLAGPYSQITRENIPDMRGLLSIYGMEYIPGPWIESIQLNKGTGSVVNGYESIAGQINVELRKPESADRLYLNLFGNEESRLEANLNLAQKLSSKWSTALLLHGRDQSIVMDKNKDGFVDKPVGNQYILLNRWKYAGDRGWQTQFGVKATSNTIQGGQVGFNPEIENGLWGMNMNMQGLDAWFKLGRISQTKPYQSFGVQLAGTAFDQDSEFGLKHYSGTQRSLYGNFIFQSIIGDTRHGYRTGMSFLYEDYSEQLDSLGFDREDAIPGVFFEYTYSPTEKLDIVSGIRADYHNRYGLFFTPRIHLRYAIRDNSVLRLSAGRGQRTAAVLTENISILASSRAVYIQGDNSNKPYGLNPEVAWNGGINFTQKFKLDYRDGAFSIDLYHTRFINQVVIDLDNDPQSLFFYDLEGKSWSTSFQAQFDYELIRRLDMRVAYRWYDVQTTYRSGLRTKPLISGHRAFINLAYSTRNHWKFDYTLQWYGPETTSGHLSKS